MGFLFITAQQTEKLIVPDSIQKAKFAETVEKIANMDLEKVLTNLVSESIWVGLKIVLALAIYMAGRWLIGRLIKLLSTAFEKRKVDRSLQIFLRNLIKTISYIVLILLIIQVMGINTTSIVALLASAGLAIGMALSGTLQNFAGGVMILLLKPYRIGDYISAQVTTADKQTIYIPNSSIATAIINNYSTSETRRVEWVIGISYGDDFATAREAILELLSKDARVLQDPAPAVYIAALADNSVNLTVRAWTKNEDYWDVFFAMNELYYKTLPEKGINFPFPQMDVHLTKE